METKKKALGKGLEQLFTNNVIDFENFEKEIVEESKNDVTEIALSEKKKIKLLAKKCFYKSLYRESFRL